MSRRAAVATVHWTEAIPDEQWHVYHRVIQAAQRRNLRFALGGAFAVATYTGHWRNTKDFDFYVLPDQRQAMIDVVTQAGLHDYFETEAYDRGWIYRATNGDTIVDVIWAMANQRSQVDSAWLERGPRVQVRGEQLRVVPVEEMIWAKLYVFQRDRFDWPDILNILYGLEGDLDWAHLLDRLGDDDRLLAGVMSVYAWLCPGQAQSLPGWLWDRLHLAPPPGGEVPQVHPRRVDLLDTRPWFGHERAEPKK